MHAVLERPLRRRGCKRNIGPAQLGARASNKWSEGDGPRPGQGSRGRSDAGCTPRSPPSCSRFSLKWAVPVGSRSGWTWRTTSG